MDRVDNSRFVASHIKGLPRSGIRDFFAIVSEMENAISLGIGEPDFATPWSIREAAIFALEKKKTSYTDNRGLLLLRCTIVAYLEKVFSLSYQPENEVLVTVGVSEAMDIALRATVNPGDKVLYHQPCYVSYSPSIQMVHGIGVPIATDAADGFALKLEALEKAWDSNCRVLILNFPTNPTGGVVTLLELEKIARFAQEKDLLVISDEIYAELTYEGVHQSIAALPGMKDRTIFLHGFSKAYAMTGFRIGYAAGSKELIEAMMKVHQYCMMCAPILSQEAAVEAFKNGQPEAQKMKEQYHHRRDYLVGRFNKMGLDCSLPKATFYAFPSVKKTGMNETEFAKRVLKEAEVAVVPGTAFGDDGAGFVRASFATSYHKLIEATDRIESFIGKNSLIE